MSGKTGWVARGRVLLAEAGGPWGKRGGGESGGGGSGGDGGGGPRNPWNLPPVVVAVAVSPVARAALLHWMNCCAACATNLAMAGVAMVACPGR